MKKLCYLLIASLSLIPTLAPAAGTASARMYCLSIAVHQMRTSYGDTIDLSYATSGEVGVNWAGQTYNDITLPGPTDYSANLDIYDNLLFYDSWGAIYLSLPAPTDANGNRFPDFFEVSRAVSTQSSGGYSYWDPYEGQSFSGSIVATWTRSAGSKSGTLRFVLSDPYWQPTPFSGTFEILEYTGTLAYVPGSNSVSGSITLAQSGNPANTWQGPIQFVKVDADRFNSLTNQAGIWTNAALESHNFTNHYFFRDPSYPTNYAGYIDFDDDGDPGTPYPFGIWVLSLTDNNDANHNGIPDFSDDPQVAPPRRPQLALTTTTTNLLLTIHGDVNHTHSVQQTSSLGPPNWQLVISVTLTNDPQTVPLSRPVTPTFWRVLAQ